MSTDASERAQIQALIDQYRAIRGCSPATPWCSEPRYGNPEHYDGHTQDRDAAVEAIIDALLSRLASLPAQPEPAWPKVLCNDCGLPVSYYVTPEFCACWKKWSQRASEAVAPHVPTGEPT